MPVREVGEVLATTDPQARSTLIAAHLERLENQLGQTRAAVTSLRRLLQPASPPMKIELRAAAAITTAAIRVTVDHSELLAWYGAAMAELDRTLRTAHLTPAGPCGGLYDNELFTDDRGNAVVYVPVANPPSSGRVRPFTVPAAELAITVHHGSHDDIDVSYGQLGTYITEHALAVAGPVRETYLAGLRETDDSAAWRTEIGDAPGGRRPVAGGSLAFGSALAPKHYREAGGDGQGAPGSGHLASRCRNVVGLLAHGWAGASAAE
jgi:effector-binding domain-containing protein